MFVSGSYKIFNHVMKVGEWFNKTHRYIASYYKDIFCTNTKNLFLNNRKIQTLVWFKKPRMCLKSWFHGWNSMKKFWILWNLKTLELPFMWKVRIPFLRIKSKDIPWNSARGIRFLSTSNTNPFNLKDFFIILAHFSPEMRSKVKMDKVKFGISVQFYCYLEF